MEKGKLSVEYQKLILINVELKFHICLFILWAIICIESVYDKHCQ